MKTRFSPLKLLLLLLALAVVALFLFILVMVGSALSSWSDPAQPESDSIMESQLDAELNQILADAQARALALDGMDADEEPILEIPAVLDNVDGVTVDLIPLNENSRPGVLRDGTTAIVVHYTGNPGSTAQQNRDYFASLATSGTDSVSSHFVIGLEGEIIQCIPLDEKSYATNHRNHDTISIECCHPDMTGAFTPETRASLVSLVRYLVKGYGLDEEGVIRHYDVTGKLCPTYYVEYPSEWEALKADIFR